MLPEGPIVKPGTIPDGCGVLGSAWCWLVKASSVCRQGSCSADPTGDGAPSQRAAGRQAACER